MEFVTIAVVMLCAGAVCLCIVRLGKRLENLSLNSLEQFSRADNRGTILLPVTKMDPKSECNTVLPLPMGAEMCAHNMDIITEKVIRAPHEERAIIILQCTKCGAVDKTIAVTSPQPKVVVAEPRSECRHNWIKEKNITLNSAFEQMEDMLKTGVKQKTGTKEEQIQFNPSGAPPWMFQKKLVKERVCNKCGEIDRVVTSNFEIEEEE